MFLKPLVATVFLTDIICLEKKSLPSGFFIHCIDITSETGKRTTLMEKFHLNFHNFKNTFNCLIILPPYLLHTEERNEAVLHTSL